MKWLDYEGGALVDGISALFKDTLELPCPFHQLRTQREDGRL